MSLQVIWPACCCIGVTGTFWSWLLGFRVEIVPSSPNPVGKAIVLCFCDIQISTSSNILLALRLRSLFQMFSTIYNLVSILDANLSLLLILIIQ
jgi:hypothetical protein